MNNDVKRNVMILMNYKVFLFLISIMLAFIAVYNWNKVL